MAQVNVEQQTYEGATISVNRIQGEVCKGSTIVKRGGEDWQRVRENERAMQRRDKGVEESGICMQVCLQCRKSVYTYR